MSLSIQAWSTLQSQHEWTWRVGHLPTSGPELEAFLDDFFRVTHEPRHSIDYFYSFGGVGNEERITVWNDDGVGVFLGLVPISDRDLFGVPRTGKRRFIHTSDRG